jgi:hypothetical protein
MQAAAWGAERADALAASEQQTKPAFLFIKKYVPQDLLITSD